MLERESVRAAARPGVEGAGAALARFSEARGYPVFQAGGALWARGVTTTALFERLPLESLVDPDLGELRRRLRAARGVGALYASRERPGSRSGLLVCFPQRYSIERVQSRRRSHVRQGLSRSHLRRLDPDELLAHGRELNVQTMGRQGRWDPELGDPRRWRRFVAAARDTPGVEVSGAFVDGRLSAYTLACRDGPWLHVRYRMSRTEDLVHRAAVALDYWLLTEAAKDGTIAAVTQGFAWVPSLDEYKRTLGYEVVAHRRVLELNPVLRPLLANGLGAAALRLAARARPSDRRLDTFARLLRDATASAEVTP